MCQEAYIYYKGCGHQERDSDYDIECSSFNKGGRCTGVTDNIMGRDGDCDSCVGGGYA